MARAVVPHSVEGRDDGNIEKCGGDTAEQRGTTKERVLGQTHHKRGDVLQGEGGGEKGAPHSTSTAAAELLTAHRCSHELG